MTPAERATEVMERADAKWWADPDFGRPATSADLTEALDAAGLLRPEWATDEARNVIAFAVSAYQTGGIDGRSKLGRAIAAYLASRQVTT